jgi:predicted metal-dependent phosphoesterase TrpH
MFADLHLHTHFSDGTFTPEELVRRAGQVGLAGIALTDHDTLDGCARTAAACAAAGIEFIPGTELTAEMEGREVHLLGYGLDPEHPRVIEEMAKFQDARQERIRIMTARLVERGVPLSAESVFALAGCKSPGRPHVARALVRAGHCRSVPEAFERFLKRDKPAWAPKRRVSAAFAIRLIHDAGGVAVLAHPGLTRSDPLIPALADLGLDGLECWHTAHSRSQTERYRELANECRLLITGGSDCHGLNKGQPVIGGVKLPWAYFEAVRERAAARRAALRAPVAAAATD